MNRRVDLHAIDAPPARWRGDVGSSPLDGASAATSSPRNEPDTLVDFHTGAAAVPEAGRARARFQVVRRPGRRVRRLGERRAGQPLGVARRARGEADCSGAPGPRQARERPPQAPELAARRRRGPDALPRCFVCRARVGAARYVGRRRARDPAGRRRAALQCLAELGARGGRVRRHPVHRVRRPRRRS